jgi:hypothetical protein
VRKGDLYACASDGLGIGERQHGDVAEIADAGAAEVGMAEAGDPSVPLSGLSCTIPKGTVAPGYT